MTEMSVLEFDTASCLPPEDNRPADRPGINSLIEGIRANGQLVPGLVCPHPELPGKYEILDGVGRWSACGKLGILFRAMLLPAPVPEAERIMLRLQHNVIRRNMTMDEIADDAARYISLKGCTQEEAAQELALSSATISRALTTKRRIPAELKPMAEALRPSIVSMIAALPTPKRCVRRSSMPPRQDAAASFQPANRWSFIIEPFKKKKRDTRVRTLKGTVDGRRSNSA